MANIIKKLVKWLSGGSKVPVAIKKETKRGNGEKSHNKTIRRWWN
jgi:hypothetical protein